MKLNKKLLFGLIDLSLLVGFLLTFFMDLTGLELHQWIGIMLGVFSLVHLALHWQWVKTITARFFESISNRTRFYYALDALIFMGFGLIIFTGLLMSSWLNLSLPFYDFWKYSHILGSISTLALIVAKIAFHWKWIVNTLKSLVQPAPAPVPQKVAAPLTPRLAPASAQANSLSRREFLGLMGVVGAAATLAVSNVVLSNKSASAQSVASQSTSSSASASTTTSVSNQQMAVVVPAQAASNNTNNPSNQQVVVPTQVVSSNTSNSTSCSVRCNKGCSFPGRCRRYTDSNGNNKCDLGECT